MIGNPIEFNPKLYPTPSEHAFTNPVIPTNATDGVKPNFGYVSSALHEHPDFNQALELLIDKWGDKDFHYTRQDGSRVPYSGLSQTERTTTSPDVVHLYSNGKRRAIANRRTEIHSNSHLDVLVDLDQFKENTDPNWQAFENLLYVNLALYAGIQERAQVQHPELSHTIPHNLFSADAMQKLSTKWHGEEEVVFSVQEKDGSVIKVLQENVDSLDGKDYDLRLRIIATERILRLQGEEIARIVSTYTPQPSNEVMLPNDETPIPLPVISQPEIVISGSSDEARYDHLELIIGRLNAITRQTGQNKEPSTGKEPIVFPIPAFEKEQLALAAD